jgi:hypothetical protein
VQHRDATIFLPYAIFIMSTQSFPVHAPVPLIDKGLTSEKPAYRTSVFRELDDLPRVWGRESQSGYTGKRALTPSSDGGKEYSVDEAALGHEGPEVVHVGRQPMPTDYGYEMPARYGGKEVAYGEDYGDDIGMPLAGNNNTWVPPNEQQKRICGLGQKVFWITLGIVCLVMISGAVAAGLIAAAASSRSASRYCFLMFYPRNDSHFLFPGTLLRARTRSSFQRPSDPQHKHP